MLFCISNHCSTIAVPTHALHCLCSMLIHVIKCFFTTRHLQVCYTADDSSATKGSSFHVKSSRIVTSYCPVHVVHHCLIILGANAQDNYQGSMQDPRIHTNSCHSEHHVVFKSSVYTTCGLALFCMWRRNTLHTSNSYVVHKIIRNWKQRNLA